MGNEIFGMDEEMRADRVDFRNKRKPYVVWPVGDREYRLKLTTAANMKLEERYKANILNLITGEGLPPIGLLLNMIQAAMEKYEHGMGIKQVQELFDEYVDMGGDVASLMTDVILPLLGNGGFFTESQAEDLKADLERA